MITRFLVVIILCLSDIATLLSEVSSVAISHCSPIHRFAAPRVYEAIHIRRFIFSHFFSIELANLPRGGGDSSFWSVYDDERDDEVTAARATDDRRRVLTDDYDDDDGDKRERDGGDGGGGQLEEEGRTRTVLCGRVELCLSRVMMQAYSSEFV